MSQKGQIESNEVSLSQKRKKSKPVKMSQK